MGKITLDEIKAKGYTLWPDGSWSKPKAGRVAPDAEREFNPVHEPVGKDAREGAYQGRCHVRVTSFRLRLLDERNLWDKHFLDALVEAGVLRGDAVKDIAIEVTQEKVDHAYQERTEMVIEEEPIPSPVVVGRG